MIEIINLKKQFKTKGKNGGKTVKTAIDNLSLAINDGEIFGLLGPNGAGKTTLVSMLAMLMRPCGGEILYDGKNAFANETFVKSQIGVVPQHINFGQDLTVWENMELHGRLHHLPEKERHARIEELLEYVGLQERRRESIKALSGGMKRRLLIVRALIHRPKVLFLDEPTVGLDPKQIIEIRDLIKSLKEKHTVILSSHILSEVSAVCDYVLIISHGKLVASDTPENLGKLAEGSNTLNLIVKGEKDKICTALGQIEGVKNVTAADAKEEYAWNVTVSTNEDCDVREEVFFKMADAKCPILEMQSRKVSLEEIFLELTEDDKKSKTSDKKMEVNSAGEAEKILEAQNGETDKKEGEDK